MKTEMQKVYCQSLTSLLIMTDSLIVVLAKKNLIISATIDTILIQNKCMS